MVEHLRHLLDKLHTAPLRVFIGEHLDALGVGSRGVIPGLLHGRVAGLIDAALGKGAAIGGADGAQCLPQGGLIEAEAHIPRVDT